MPEPITDSPAASIDNAAAQDCQLDALLAYRDALRAAIGSPALEVEFEGRKVRHRSVEELSQALAEVQRLIDESQPKPATEPAKPAEEAAKPTVAVAASESFTDPILNFLSLVLGDKEKAIAARASILAAFQDPRQQRMVLDALRRDAGGAEFFGPAAKDDEPDDDDVQFVASTANDKDGTIDCVWYGGATVPRINQSTGDPYMLQLDMQGCRLERLNAGAPIFDTHFTGDDFKSIAAGLVTGKVGTKAQVGVVQKAWAKGPKGMATLQFDLGNPDGAELYRKTKGGILRNLSFGTWIYKKEQMTRDQVEAQMAAGSRSKQSLAADDVEMFTATDWEPFEISPVTIPADFTTQFLTAQTTGKPQPERATSPKEHTSMPDTTGQVTGAEALKAAEKAVADKAAADAVLRAETITLERQRVSEIRAAGVTHKMEALATVLIGSGATIEEARSKFTQASEITQRASKFKTQLGEEFIASFINEGKTPDQFSSAALEKLAGLGQQNVEGAATPIQGGVTITRDARDTVRQQMEAAILFRENRSFYSDWSKAFRHDDVDKHFHQDDEERYDRMRAAQKELSSKARQYANFSLTDMARECLEVSGVNVRGLSNHAIAERALKGAMPDTLAPREYGDIQFFGDPGGMQGTSDFPAILANVANKTLRMSYEAYPRTFLPFSRQVTAKDFKTINRVMLSDAPVLVKINEKGEYTRASLKDSNQPYALSTFGRLVLITRQAIINDDLQAFTRIPALMGVSAAQMESDVVWAIITGNQIMGEDGIALFDAAHNNTFSGASSALGLGATMPPTGLTNARTAMRQQVGPNGTHLNIVPRFVAVPVALETPLLQLLDPISLLSSDASKVVPNWTRATVPIVEPRLDSVSTTGWYVIADPAQIDTIEYAYLEGQTGVYIETRQGWEIDGTEMKVREDFGAAAIDHRGFAFSAGV